MQTVFDGIPLVDIPAYAYGSEPIEYPFLVGVGVLWAFNFSDTQLESGKSVKLVLDMFQRLVYSKQETSVVVCAGVGGMQEPTVSSPYRGYSPNFVPTNKFGQYVPKDERDRDPSFLHSLCSGLVRLADKPYAPLRGTYLGGEEYIDEYGELQTRSRGELLRDRENRPVYLLRRELEFDEKMFPLHADFFLTHNAGGTNSYANDLFSDSPYQYVYADGQECSFDIKPIPVAGAFPEEWEHTLDWQKAQTGWDICLVPDAADGEAFVKGEQMCFARKVSFVRQPTFNWPLGKTDLRVAQETHYDWEDADPEFRGPEPENPDPGDDKWYQYVGYTYWEPAIPDTYFEGVRGQAVTKGVYFKIVDGRLQQATVNQMGVDGLVEEYVRLHLEDGTGLPQISDETKVCRLRECVPSRGVFIKTDSDGVHFPLMTTPKTSRDYGLPVAKLHKFLNEQTKHCLDIIEHPQYELDRLDYELMLTAANECWKRCGTIESVRAPSLGDPRALPKRIIYVVRNSD